MDAAIGNPAAARRNEANRWFVLVIVCIALALGSLIVRTVFYFAGVDHAWRSHLRTLITLGAPHLVQVTYADGFRALGCTHELCRPSTDLGGRVARPAAGHARPLAYSGRSNNSSAPMALQKRSQIF